MKTKLSKNWVVGAVTVILCLTGGTGFVASAQDESAPPPTAAVPTDNTATADNTVPADSTALPPNIHPSSPLAQVIKLTQAGVSDDVIMTYVTNSGSTFNLDTDKIIYLRDIGAPDNLVTAMMQRDQVLQAQMAVSAYQPPPQPTPVTEIAAAAPAPTEVTVVQPAPVTVDYFYTTLAPYGAWVDVEGYGRCWRPTVVAGYPGWQPYCDHGHWIWTDCGWYWISDYSWGWAPFHYGRWFHHARFGWCWTPDTVWGPSWVTWRYSGDFCGWAPLPPRAVYREGFGFYYNGAVVSAGFDFGLGVGAFTFVHTRDFCDTRPWRHRVESREVTQIFNRTTVINNFDVDRHNRNFINHGIDPEHITQVTHAPIRPIAIQDAPRPGNRGDRLGRDGHTLFVNRPHFSDNPRPSMDQGNPTHTTPVARPGIGSPYPTPDNHRNDNAGPQRRNQPTPPTPGQPQPLRPTIGSPYQTPDNHRNDNAEPQHRNQPTPTPPTPGQPQPLRPTVGSPYQAPNNNIRNDHSQPQPPRADTSGSPNRNGPTPPIAHPAPPTPVQPSTPNYNSPDNRRYPSPRMQVPEQPNPRMNSGNSGGHATAPVTPPSPPAHQPEATRFNPPPQPPAPAQPQQRNYVAPRNETPPSESRPNYSQPQAQGNQSRGASAPSSPPAQSQQSQGSGRDKNKNGQ